MTICEKQLSKQNPIAKYVGYNEMKNIVPVMIGLRNPNETPLSTAKVKVKLGKSANIDCD